MSTIRRNVVSVLYAVNVKVGDGKYCFRVQAESDATAMQKAERQMQDRFGKRPEYRLLSIDRIEPGDELQ